MLNVTKYGHKIYQSPDFNATHSFIHALGKPLLGACYGHTQAVELGTRDNYTRPHTLKKFKVYRQVNQKLTDREVRAFKSAKGAQRRGTG